MNSSNEGLQYIFLLRNMENYPLLSLLSLYIWSTDGVIISFELIFLS